MATKRALFAGDNESDYSDSDTGSVSDFSSDDSIQDKDYNPSDSSSESLSEKEDENDTVTEPGGLNDDYTGLSRGSIVSPEKNPKSRWRKSNIECRKKFKTKTRRNLGYSYKDVKGREREAKILGPPCTCKKKCRELLQGSEGIIFNSFWDLETYEKQNTYLFSTIKVVPKKRSYKKKIKRQESARRVTNLYYVKVNGVDIQICKQEFLSVHGLQKSSKRIKLIAQEISEGRTTPKKDGRGKHKNRPNKTPAESVQSVHDHIQAIPKYVSHYSRKINPNRVFLNHDYSISSLYKDHYVEWCKTQNVMPVKEDRYRRIFCSEYNIGFKLPKSDTCHTCDFLNTQIEGNKGDDSRVNDLTIKLQLHQTKALAMQENLKQEVKQNEENKSKDIISFDLQQTLPTPSLTVGPAFYLRKAWTYNLGIHDCVTGKGSMFMWSEPVAKRGSEEVASILLKYLKSKSSHAEHLVVFTDNCGGQNKNWVIMSLWLQLVREGMYKSIEHRFLISGHTHLPSDRDFAIIEKHKKYINQVYCPEEWFDIVRKANRKNPFNVFIMKQEEFYKFDVLSVTKKNVTIDKQPLKFSEGRCFKFDTGHPNSMFIKHALNTELFMEVNVGRRGSRIANQGSTNNLTQKYSGKIALSDKKVQDLKKLLQYIPPINQRFFIDIIGDETFEVEAVEDQPENIDGTEDCDDYVLDEY